ncbi:MAG: hypothetical protein LAO23_21840 [Acidobacteriia bacterium]|nr:hypothetical protein [Terriglobia bacterium]
MNAKVVIKKATVEANQTLISPADPNAPAFDWKAVIRKKPDPFFDTARWIGTVGGHEVTSGSLLSPSIDGHKERFNSLQSVAAKKRK